MRLLVNAIITGFGLKLGGDIYRLVKKKLGLPDTDDDRVPPVESEQQS